MMGGRTLIASFFAALVVCSASIGQERPAAVAQRPALSLPLICGDLHIFTRCEPGARHATVCVRKEGMNERDDERVVLDPAQIGAGGSATLDAWFPAPDGSLIAYISTTPDGKTTLRLRDTRSVRDTMLVIPVSRGSTVAWESGGTAFLYTRDGEGGSRRVYRHKFGTDAGRDPIVFGDAASGKLTCDVYASGDSRWQFVRSQAGDAKSQTNDLHIRKSGAGLLTPVAVGLNARFIGDVRSETLYLLTNLEAPRCRVMSVDVAKPDRADWREIIPQQSGTIREVRVCGGMLVVSIVEGDGARLAVFGADGAHERDIELPASGIVTGISGKHDKPQLYFTLEAAGAPAALFSCNVKSGAVSAIEE
jgi:prolyl oligopeptidase